MRHATRSQRLSMPTAHREALLNNLVKSLVVHGQIRTTYARAKEAQRRADRLIHLGKDGSVHARRMALRVLQERDLVKRLFADIAPQFLGTQGGYTRVVRLKRRRGDGAEVALLALSRLPEALSAIEQKPKPIPIPRETPKESPTQPEAPKAEKKKPKGFFEGLRDLWRRKNPL